MGIYSTKCTVSIVNSELDGMNNVPVYVKSIWGSIRPDQLYQDVASRISHGVTVLDSYIVMIA